MQMTSTCSAASKAAANLLCTSLVRKPAPSFRAKAIIDGAIKEFSSDSLAGKYWMIFFYPLNL
jgi:alkyl hydroperoxide reductase subunit AhpC